ncbi:MAG: glycine zipper 2TM domain-containing protein [Plesiomonas sp.]|uniref:glycine zipper 2TM domain-containing protein n=1 Tax=Plesiomonas sp. TaxID=2486279 RepID=UPI003F30E7C1
MNTRLGALAFIAMSLAGCANTNMYSGDVYSGAQAKTVQNIQYGTIVSIRPVKIQAESSGLIGGIGGAVVGGLLGSTVGGGTGRDIASAAGAIAGSAIGKKAEDSLNQINGAEMEIRKDNGASIVVVQKADPRYQPGVRVRLVGGNNDMTVSVM